jgi:hypothetical protein
MVDIGKLAKKAKNIVDKHGDKIATGVDKATDFVDEKSKGKYHDKLEKVDELALKLDKAPKPEPRADEPARFRLRAKWGGGRPSRRAPTQGLARAASARHRGGTWRTGSTRSCHW